MRPSTLRGAIRNLMREQPRPELRIVPEKAAPYKAVAKVLWMLSRAKYEPHLGFVGEECPDQSVCPSSFLYNHPPFRLFGVQGEWNGPLRMRNSPGAHAWFLIS
jgi:hypothetical protein